VKQDTPLGLLRGIKFGTETYHTLFMRLCRSVILVLGLYTQNSSHTNVNNRPNNNTL